MNPNVISISLPSTREKVLELFKEYGISAVPVLKKGKLVGIVTRKDILRKIDEDQAIPSPAKVAPSEVTTFWWTQEEVIYYK